MDFFCRSTIFPSNSVQNLAPCHCHSGEVWTKHFIGFSTKWTYRLLRASTIGDDTWNHLLSAVRTGNAVIGSLRQSRSAFGCGFEKNFKWCCSRPFFALTNLKADAITVTRKFSALDTSNVEIVVLSIFTNDVPVTLFFGKPLKFSLHMHSKKCS